MNLSDIVTVEVIIICFITVRSCIFFFQDKNRGEINKFWSIYFAEFEPTFF